MGPKAWLSWPVGQRGNQALFWVERGGAIKFQSPKFKLFGSRYKSDPGMQHEMKEKIDVNIH